MKAIPTADVGDLAVLFDIRGPFASVYMTSHRRAWARSRRALRASGAHPEVIDALATAVGDLGPESRGVAAIGTAEGILHFETWDVPPARDVAVWTTLPMLAPLIRHRQGRIPHILLILDPSGADVLVAADRPPEFELRSDNGGSAMPRVVHRPGFSPEVVRSEKGTLIEAVRVTAADLERIVERVTARAIVAAGHAATAELLHDALPADLRPLMHIAPEGARWEELSGFIDHTLLEVRESEEDRAIRAFHGALRRGRAVQGVAEVNTAAGAGHVETLLLHDDPGDRRVLSFVGAEGEPVTGRLADVLVRATLRTGGGGTVRILDDPDALCEGVGALMRKGRRVPRV